MTNDDFWPFYTEKLSDLDPTLVILLLLVTIYCYIKCAQKSDWILPEKINCHQGFCLTFCQFLRLEFFRIFDKNSWTSKKVIEYCLKKLKDFFCCCYWAIATDQAFVWLFVSWRLLLLKKTIIVLLWLKKYPGKTRCLLF